MDSKKPDEDKPDDDALSARDADEFEKPSETEEPNEIEALVKSEMESEISSDSLKIEQPPKTDSSSDSSKPNLKPNINVDLKMKAPKIELPSSSSSNDSKNSRKRVLTWILIILLVILAAGAAAYYYFFVMNKDDSPKNTNNTGVHKALTAEELVAKTKEALSGNLIEIVKSDEVSGTASDNVLVYSAPTYATNGNKFRNLPTKTYGTGSFGDEKIGTTHYAKVVSILKEEGLTEEFSVSGKPGDTKLATSIYASKMVVCQATHYHFESYVVGLACSDMANYVEGADTAAPFYTALTKSSNYKVSENLEIGAPIIKDGKEGFKYAIVKLSNFNETTSSSGWFYLPEGGEWKFFNTVQATPICEDFNTTELKNAFYGEACNIKDSETSSTVGAGSDMESEQGM